MFTKLVVSFFDTATNLVNTKVPHFALDSQVFSNASNAVSVISDFLRDVNFIIPLKDYLGYSPETIEITIDISYFLCDIIIEDVKYKKRVEIPLIGLISNSYTEEDTLK